MSKYKYREEIRCPVTNKLYTLFDEPIFYGSQHGTKRDIRELNRQIKTIQSIYSGLQQGSDIGDVVGMREFLYKLKNSVRKAIEL